MAELTGQPIVTNYGKTQILASTADITKIKLGSGIWTPTAASTALNTQESSVAATGAIIPIPAGGSRLHINGQDAGGGSYNLHEFALTDDTDQALVIYSQAATIDTKGVASVLVFAADLVIEQAGVGTISISGVTDFDLPQASTALKGIIEIATDAEVLAATDTTRAITPGSLDKVEEHLFLNDLMPRAHVSFTTGGSAAIVGDLGPGVVSFTPFASPNSYIAIQFAASLGTSLMAFATLQDRGAFSNIGQIEARMTSSTFLEFTFWNNSNQKVDPTINTTKFAVTIFGAAP